VTLEGFVTIGRGELLLSMLAVALLMLMLGVIVAQLVAKIRAPAPIKLRPITPEDEERGRRMLREMCPGPHCDDDKQMMAWLRSKDYSLITNEMLHEMKQRTEFAHRRADAAAQIRPAFDLDPSLIETLKASMAKAHPADGPEITKWPGGDPDAV
jgi:hypothetical protein